MEYREYINNTTPDIYDEEFIGIINDLSESIKEYYKVSKHNIKETNSFLGIFENKWKEMENYLKTIIQEKSLSTINLVFQSIEQSKIIVRDLQNNSNSNYTNLNLFFKDAKILFSKMKSKRNENLLNCRRSMHSSSNKNYNINLNNINSTGKNDILRKNSRMLNVSNNQNINPETAKKIIYYLNQLKDYNEIIGKFSVKAKFNFINLQNMLFDILNDNKNNNLEETLIRKSNQIFNNSNYSTKNNVNNPEEVMNIFDVKNKYEKEIQILNSKIKDLEKNIEKNESFDVKKIEELKKKIELELLSNNNNNYNFDNQNDFETMVLNLIDRNKNLNMELKNIKAENQKKNETIKNLNLIINKLKHDLLSKDNILQEKEKERIKSEEPNKLMNLNNNINNNNLNYNINSTSNIDTIIELRKRLKNLYIENDTLRHKVNDLNLNIINNSQSRMEAKSDIYFNNNKEVDNIKKELELERRNSLLNKKKYEKEINNLNKKGDDLSKKLTLKIHQIILLQRENLKFKSLLTGKKNINNINNNNNNSNININLEENQMLGESNNNSNKSKSLPKNNKNNNLNKNELYNLKDENIKLKNMISKYQKENNSMRNSLYKLGQKNKELNNQIMMQGQNKNYNDRIMNLQQELTQLRKITEENNYKSLEYEQQINNLQNILNEKDELINQYKDTIQNLKNNNLKNMNNNNNDINQMNKINNTLLNELDNKNKEINILKKQISNNNNNNNLNNNNNNNNILNQKIIQLNNVIEEDKKQIQLLNEQIMKLKTSGHNEDNQNDLINKYKNELEQLNNAFLKANSIIEEKDLIIKKFEEKANGTNGNNQNLQIKINELEEKIKQLEQENKNLTDEIMSNNNLSNNPNINQNEEILNQINLLNLKISHLEEENEYYKNKAEELQEQIKNLQKNDGKENTLDMIIDNKETDEIALIRKENKNLEFNLNQLKQEISNLNKLNEQLKQECNLEKNKNAKLLQENSNINKKNKELLEKTPNNNNINNNKGNDLETQLKKKEDEVEGMKTFAFKLQKDLEKAKEDNDVYKSKIISLQKENISMKKQLERLSITMPKELNALQTQLDEANKKNQIYMTNNSNLNNNINNSQKNTSLSNTDRNKKKLKDKNKTLDNGEFQQEKYNNLLSQLNEANKEITELKNKNKELVFQLEEKDVKSAFSGFRTDDVNISNYEEEFDLRKMANGARDKNRSEDINIDYPGIQGVKEKLKELEFRYKNLVEQVKILIGNITFNQKIKPQISQICQLLGYSPKTIGRILTSTKDKKKLLGV